MIFYVLKKHNNLTNKIHSFNLLIRILNNALNINLENKINCLKLSLLIFSAIEKYTCQILIVNLRYRNNRTRI